MSTSEIKNSLRLVLDEEHLMDGCVRTHDIRSLRKAPHPSVAQLRMRTLDILPIRGHGRELAEQHLFAGNPDVVEPLSTALCPPIAFGSVPDFELASLA